MHRNRKHKGSTILEMTIALPLFALLVNGLINVGTGLRRCSVAIEASRHAARSSAARAAQPGVGMADFLIAQTARTISCAHSGPPNVSGVPSALQKTAIVSACAFLEISKTDPADWTVTARGLHVAEGGINFAAMEVTVNPQGHGGVLGLSSTMFKLNTGARSIFILEI